MGWNAASVSTHAWNYGCNHKAKGLSLYISFLFCVTDTYFSECGVHCVQNHWWQKSVYVVFLRKHVFVIVHNKVIRYAIFVMYNNSICLQIKSTSTISPNPKQLQFNNIRFYIYRHVSFYFHDFFSEWELGYKHGVIWPSDKVCIFTLFLMFMEYIILSGHGSTADMLERRISPGLSGHNTGIMDKTERMGTVQC